MAVDPLTGVLLFSVPSLMGLSGYLGWVVQRDRQAHRALSLAAESQHQINLRNYQQELEQWRERQLGEHDRIARKLQECLEANARYADDEQRYIDVIRQSQLRIEGFERDGVQIRRHTVLLDGMSGAGKTTLIERLTNPAATTEDLSQIPATASARRLDPVPLCWEITKDNQRILHTLEFYDMGGESPAQVVDNIKDFLAHRQDDESSGQAIVLVLWNSEAELDPDPKRWNTEMLSPPRLAATYGTRDARTAIASFVFFMNKIDLVQERLRAEGREVELEDFLRQQHERLIQDVYRRALAMYPEPALTYGSAADGRGVHDCLGAILRQLGLHRHYSGRAK